VEIMTSSSSHGPSRDWLNIVKTSEAKAKIRAWLKREERDENIAHGRDMLEKEAKRLGYALSALNRPELIETLYKRYSVQSLDDIYAMVGFGGLSTQQVLNRLIDEYKKNQKVEEPPVNESEAKREDAAKRPQQHSSASNGVIVKGESGMLVRFARCCNPLPGDEIIGYITRGRGVTVHKADCPNMQHETDERLVEVTWADPEANAEFNAGLNIIAYDHVSLLGELAMVIGNMGIPIVAASAKRDQRKKTSVITTVVQVKSREQLDRLIKQIQKRGDVVDVYRSSN
jgi:GTP pyrophosphokinase